MKNKLLTVLAGLITLFSANQALAVDAPAPPATLYSSRVFRADAYQRVNVIDYINLKGGQSQLPLSLVLLNGAEGGAGLRTFKVTLGNQPIATEADFAGQRSYTVDLKGKITDGGTAIMIKGSGQPGATFAWKLTTPPVQLDAVDPKAGAIGDKVTLTGANFSPVKSDNVVDFNGVKADVQNAGTKTLVVLVPKDAKGGENKVTVTTLGIKTKPGKFKVKVPPELSSITQMSAPPGLPLTISGKNFSEKMSDNKVLFGGVEAQITSGNSTSLSVIIPELTNPQYGVPITVETDGMKSTNTLTIDIQNRVF